MSSLRPIRFLLGLALCCSALAASCSSGTPSIEDSKSDAARPARPDAGTEEEDAGEVVGDDAGGPGADAGGPGPDAGADAGPTRFRVLFDDTHAEQAGNADWVVDDSGRIPAPATPASESDWTGGYSAWGFELARAGDYDVETLAPGSRITWQDASNPQDLSRYEVFVVPEPNSAFTRAEMTAMVEFVRAGGGLFMIADHGGSDRNGDGVDSVGAWNGLATTMDNPFGIKFAGDDLYQAPDRQVVDDPRSPILHGPFGDVTATTYFNGSTMVLDPSANPTARALIYKNKVLSGTTGVTLAVAELGSGRVAAFGDSSAADDGTGAPGDALKDGWTDPLGNNRALFLNLTAWLADRRCQDRVLDGSESDVDCGGRCSPCARGKRCVAAADCGSGECTDGTCTGITLERLDAPCSHPGIALDLQGTPHLAWSSGTALMYSTLAGGSWSRQLVATRSATYYTDTRIALDPAGAPAIAFNDAGQVYLARKSGGSWSKQAVGAFPYVWGLGFDPQGRPNLLVTDETSSLKLATLAGAQWTASEIEPGSKNYLGNYLALDGAGRPHVLYAPYPGPGAQLATLENGTWAIELVRADAFAAGLAYDAAGQPRVLVTNANGIDYGVRSGAAWTFEPIVANAMDSVLALDAAGSPFAAFLNNDPALSPMPIALASRTSGAWKVSALVSGSNPTLAIDGAGGPRLVFSGGASPYPLLYAH